MFSFRILALAATVHLIHFAEERENFFLQARWGVKCTVFLYVFHTYSVLQVGVSALGIQKLSSYYREVVIWQERLQNFLPAWLKAET